MTFFAFVESSHEHPAYYSPKGRRFTPKTNAPKQVGGLAFSLVAFCAVCAFKGILNFVFRNSHTGAGAQQRPQHQGPGKRGLAA